MHEVIRTHDLLAASRANLQAQLDALSDAMLGDRYGAVIKSVMPGGKLIDSLVRLVPPNFMSLNKKEQLWWIYMGNEYQKRA